VIAELTSSLASALRTLVRRAGALGRTLVRQRRVLGIGAGVIAFALFASLSVANPALPSSEDQLQAYLDEHAQTYTVGEGVTVAVSDERGDYSASPGIQTLKAEGTNYAWAKMVMLFGGWPMSDENITVFTRWMRQENGPDDWYNRNNPLNNGWGTQGGTFLSGYANLVDAAEQCAEALHTNPGYAGIANGFANSLPMEQTEAAIWASPWATGHYNNGAHWHYTPVDIVVAPAGAWG
jgi:hypothetical protein